MINTYTFGQTVTHELQGDKTYMVLKHGDSDGLHVLTEEGELAILHLSHVRMKSNTPSIKAADMAEVLISAKKLQNNMLAYFGYAAKQYMDRDINKFLDSLKGLVHTPARSNTPVFVDEIKNTTTHGKVR